MGVSEVDCFRGFLPYTIYSKPSLSMHAHTYWMDALKAILAKLHLLHVAARRHVTHSLVCYVLMPGQQARERRM
jgi:hypothetical protein